MGLSVRGLWLRVVLWSLAVLVCGSSFAAGMVELDPAQQPVRLHERGEYWLDETGKVPAGQVARDKTIPWQEMEANKVYPLSYGKALWVRFTRAPIESMDSDRWYLEVPYAAVDLVTLYSQDAGGLWTQQAAGDSLAVESWPVPHRHPLLPLARASDQPRTYLVRVENSHGYSAPLQFVSDSHQSYEEQRVSLLLGIYFGLAALAFIVGLVSAITLRDQAYAMYCLTVITMGLTQAAITGIAGLHLWSSSPAWNDLAPYVLPILSAGCIYIFVSVAISVRERWPALHWVLIGLGILSVPLSVGIALVTPPVRFLLYVPYAALSPPLVMAVLIWGIRRGDRYALWLLAGNLPLAAAAAVAVARTAGLLPATFWTAHSMQLALAIELPILLLMLIRRSQHRREHIRRIQGLDRIDPATGLINAAVFDERLRRLIARSVRLKYRSAILLVDIVNLDQIRKQFDRHAAQELPLRVAGRLMSAAREIDSVARLSDHRFGLLLEGPLKAGEVAEAAPRVVARCLMPFRNRPIEWMAQVRVAQALIPMDGTDPEQLMALLEKLLASAPPESKRAVFTPSRPGGLTGTITSATTTS